MESCHRCCFTHSQDPADPEIKPSNDGGGSVSPQGFDNIYEWMNAQVLTAPEITNPRW